MHIELTGKAAVNRILTDLCVIDVTANGLVVRAIAPGVTASHIEGATDA